MNFCRRLKEGCREKGSKAQRGRETKVQRFKKKNLAKARRRKVFFFILLCDFAPLREYSTPAEKKLSESLCKIFVNLCGKTFYDLIKNPIFQRGIH